MTSWLSGIDISVHQASTPSLGGLDFVFARATYGTSPDSRYPQHANATRKAGIVVGAYHFGRNSDATKQAEAFIASLERVPTKLVALDWEADAGHPTMTRSQAIAFIRAMRERGYRCGLYRSEAQFTDVGQDFDWIANWSRQPARPWDFWQTRGSPLDLDVCRWTEAELRLAESGLPDTSTGGYVGAIVITRLPYGGSVTIPAGVGVTFLRLDLAAGTVADRIAQAPRTSPSAAPYDARADLSGINVRGNPFVRIAEGPFAGLFLSEAGVSAVDGTAPVADCTDAIATARAEGYRDGADAGTKSGYKAGVGKVGERIRAESVPALAADVDRIVAEETA